MGKYKVFNGTDWVDICNCQVNIRNASNDWQLLDPKNCVTKYWTGTEWCEVTCCTCPEGYTLSASGNICEKIERVPATANGGVFYPITPGNTNVLYGDSGAALYADISGATFPLNGFDFPNYVVKDNAGTGITYPKVTSDPNNQIFNTQGTSTTKGRLNYSSIWGTGYPDDTLFTVRFCVTITEAKTYIFALAGDNQVNASITSTTFQGGVTDLNIINLWGSSSPTGSPEQASNTRPFNYWHMFPITLPVGTHTFKLSGYNFSGDVAFGAEVYNISVANMLTLIASTTATPADLEPYILFTTKDLIQSPPLLLPAPGQTGITYTCPSGYTFTDCYGVPQCTIDLSYPCGGTPPPPYPYIPCAPQTIYGNGGAGIYKIPMLVPANTCDISIILSISTVPDSVAIMDINETQYYVQSGFFGKLSLQPPLGSYTFGPYPLPQNIYKYDPSSLTKFTIDNTAPNQTLQIVANQFPTITNTDPNIIPLSYDPANPDLTTRMIKWNKGVTANDVMVMIRVVGNPTETTGWALTGLTCSNCQPIPTCSCASGEVVIGTQTWTCKNLNVETYRNGDIIPHVTDPAIWASLTSGAWCYYNNDPSTEATYGKLYNWYAVTDSRNIAPDNYHVPNAYEFNTLNSFLGNGYVSGGKLKEAGTTHWADPNLATNSSCFTALPGGQRSPDDGSFNGMTLFGYFWSTTVDTGSVVPKAFGMRLVHSLDEFMNYSVFSTTGYSVRLVKN